MPFREAHDQVSRNLADLPALAKKHGVTLNGMLAKKTRLAAPAPERVKEGGESGSGETAVRLPKGFLASGIRAGIRKKRPDSD